MLMRWITLGDVDAANYCAINVESIIAVSMNRGQTVITLVGGVEIKTVDVRPRKIMEQIGLALSAKPIPKGNTNE